MPTTEKPHVISLHLQTVMKQSLYLTIVSLLLLHSLKWMLYSFSFNAFSLKAIVSGILIVSIGYFILIILHEFFHLLGFKLFGKVSWRSMKVGADLQQGIAYATTTMHMPNHAVKKALLLPFWMTGIVPAILGLIFDHTSFLILGALLIGGAAGDFSMYRQLKQYPNHWMVQDDPALPKMYIYDPAANIKEKSLDALNE